MRTTSLIQFWRILLDPTRKRAVIYFHPALAHHLFQLAVADGIEAVPADTPENDFREKVTPLEGRFGVHGACVGD